ncbi:MAG: hypothetical protein WA631_19805 [Nitrososphaeraceae archaeon]
MTPKASFKWAHVAFAVKIALAIARNVTSAIKLKIAGSFNIYECPIINLLNNHSALSS